MKEILEKSKIYAPLVLRVGLALVFLWFGSQQLMNPSDWAGLIPESIVSISSISALNFVFLNGLFEVVFGVALLVGFYTRIVALLLALHLFGIAFTVGYNDVGVRDFGLAVSTLAVAMQGPGLISLDAFLNKRAQV